MIEQWNCQWTLSLFLEWMLPKSFFFFGGGAIQELWLMNMKFGDHFFTEDHIYDHDNVWFNSSIVLDLEFHGLSYSYMVFNWLRMRHGDIPIYLGGQWSNQLAGKWSITHEAYPDNKGITYLSYILTSQLIDSMAHLRIKGHDILSRVYGSICNSGLFGQGDLTWSSTEATKMCVLYHLVYNLFTSYYMILTNQLANDGSINGG